MNFTPNWKHVVAQAIARGYTQKQIAEYCGCTAAYVSDIARGKRGSVGYSIGVRLLELASPPRPRPALPEKS